MLKTFKNIFLKEKTEDTKINKISLTQKLCPKCQTSNDILSKYCVSCGEKL